MVSDHFRELAQVSDARREEILRASKAPAFDSLAGYEWIGFNVSALVRMLGLRLQYPCFAKRTGRALARATL